MAGRAGALAQGRKARAKKNNQETSKWGISINKPDRNDV